MKIEIVQPQLVKTLNAYSYHSTLIQKLCSKMCMLKFFSYLKTSFPFAQKKNQFFLNQKKKTRIDQNLIPITEIAAFGCLLNLDLQNIFFENFNLVNLKIEIMTRH